MRRIAAVSFLSFLMLGAAQREPQLPRVAGETIEVSLVNLDVVVTDKQGRRVHGLTANDFEVLEDGKPQAITNFSAFVPDDPSLPAPLPSPRGEGLGVRGPHPSAAPSSSSSTSCASRRSSAIRCSAASRRCCTRSCARATR
jgi:hypothetical protein